MPESLNCYMPIRRRCLITEFFNSNCTAFFASFQRTSALSFTEPSPHPSPSHSVDLCSICALVRIFYCFLCTSRNSLSLAEHNCAPVKVSLHWLLRFSALVVNWSIWVTCHGVATFKGICICRNEDCSLIDIGTVFRVISSFTDAEKFWFIESVWKPDLLFEFRRKKHLESSESFDRTIAELRKLNKPECFQLRLTRQRTFLTKKTFSCPPLCRLFKEYSRGVFWFPPLLRRNNW